MISYYTAAAFMVQRNPGNAPAGAVGRTIARTQWNVPSGYAPKLSKVGQPSRKVFIADGGKYSQDGAAPDFQTNFTQSNGGAYADQAPCTPFTAAWSRSSAPTNGGASSIDSRSFAFRHQGRVQRGGAPDSYRMNVAFFDGHVEALGDLEASRPEFWFPKGTQIDNNTTQLYKDVQARYMQGVGATFTVP